MDAKTNMVFGSSWSNLPKLGMDLLGKGALKLHELSGGHNSTESPLPRIIHVKPYNEHEESDESEEEKENQSLLNSLTKKVNGLRGTKKKKENPKHLNESTNAIPVILTPNPDDNQSTASRHLVTKSAISSRSHRSLKSSALRSHSFESEDKCEMSESHSHFVAHGFKRVFSVGGELNEMVKKDSPYISADVSYR